MDDNTIIDLLFDRSEVALDEITRKYAPLYRGLLRDILSNECDVDEIENDLLVAIWNSIPPNRPMSLSAYVCKLARRIGIDRLRYNTRQKRGRGYTLVLSELEDVIGEEDSYVSSDERIVSVITEFVRGLDAETQVLFIRRYVYFETVASLAQRFELKENHVSVKLYRARKRLKKVLEGEGIVI